MRPFEVSPALEPLRELYPSVDAILRAAQRGDRDTRYAIARLWLSEGIPYSFKGRPGVYEALRRWLAHRLDVHAKEITLVGSGRQGFCLSPGPDLGRPFGDHSDLDLTVIRQSLFERLKDSFARWDADYTGGGVAPRHERERQLWQANRQCVPSGLVRGFIDPREIPTWDRYPEAQMISQALYEAHDKLAATSGAPVVRKPTVRVYRDWDCFIRQMAINLESAATRLA
jgi:hypothetical protein